MCFSSAFYRLVNIDLLCHDTTRYVDCIKKTIFEVQGEYNFVECVLMNIICQVYKATISLRRTLWLIFIKSSCITGVVRVHYSREYWWHCLFQCLRAWPELWVNNFSLAGFACWLQHNTNATDINYKLFAYVNIHC